MKSKKILITILMIMTVLLIATIKVEAASAEIYSSKTTAEVGDEVTITAKFTAAAWNVKVSGNGITGETYASQTSDLSETENVKTFKLNTSTSGTYTITIAGDITDANGETSEISKSCTVTVNEKQVTADPEPEPEPEPETPTVEETPNFTDVNKTMYASKDINLRESWSTSSKATSIDKGTELTITGTSTNKVNGYVWYRVTYNGKTLYVASNLLTNTKPEEDVEEPTSEEPAEETPADEPTTVDTTDDDTEATDGLKSLEIEGITLSPSFSAGVYEYRAILEEDLSELVINAITASEGATVTIAGNKDLAEGENLITIVVYNTQNEVVTYQITINKNTLDLSITDNLLKSGTLAAKRERIIYITIFAISLVGLVVVMILRSRITNDEEDYEEEYDEDYPEFTENEQTVENAEENDTTQEQMDQDETRRQRREKRKGKHF